MNKKELIESISHLPSDCSGPRPMIDKLTTLELIKLLDETWEAEIPMFVADFIAEQKKLGHTLSYSIDACMSDGVAEWYWDNSELFALSWVNGYTVEKEKQYYVRFKGMESDDFNYLNFIKFQHAWVLSSIKLDKKFRTEHTKKQLEEAGFDWVFDCPGIEIEEVTE